MSKHRVPYQWDGVLVDFQKLHWADGSFRMTVNRHCDGLDVCELADAELNLNWTVRDLSEVLGVVRAACWEVARTYRTDIPTWRDIPVPTLTEEVEKLF